MRSLGAHLDKRRHLVRAGNPRLQHFLVRLCPGTNRQLDDLDGCIVELANRAGDLESVVAQTLDGSLAMRARIKKYTMTLTLKPRYHGSIGTSSSPFIKRRRFAKRAIADGARAYTHTDKVVGIVTRNGRAP